MRESGRSPLFIGELVRFSDVVDVTAARRRAGRTRQRRAHDADARVRAAATDEPASGAGPPAARRGRRLRPAAAHAARDRAPPKSGASGDRSDHGALVCASGTHPRHRGRAKAIEVYHDRIRETVIARMTSSDLRAVHAPARDRARSGARLEPETLVEHFRGAGPAERAAPYALDAADRAREALAFDRAAPSIRSRSISRRSNRRRAATSRFKRGDALAADGRGHHAAEVYLARRVRRAGRRSASS